MKKKLLLLLISIASIALSAQNLTLAQLLEVKKKDLGNAEEYLSAKGWEFSSATAPSDGKLGRATFTYDKSELSSGAVSFLTYYYSSHYEVTRLSIQVNNRSKYTEYLNAIKSYGCKLISSEVDDGDIVKVYRGKTTTFKIISSTSQSYFNEESAVWLILISSNEDYDSTFGDQ